MKSMQDHTVSEPAVKHHEKAWKTKMNEISVRDHHPESEPSDPRDLAPRVAVGPITWKAKKNEFSVRDHHHEKEPSDPCDLTPQVAVGPNVQQLRQPLHRLQQQQPADPRDLAPRVAVSPQSM